MHELGIFAKYWAPGEVKTRLARALGGLAAAEIYRNSLVTTLERMRGAADLGVICYSPRQHASDFAALAGDWWALRPQASGDLGQRMAAYFNAAFAAGRHSVVLIGSDSPTLPLERIRLAFESLHTHDAVLGKATDGGYYLIGLARPCPEIFTDIAWSTPQVWEQTTNALSRLGKSWQALEAWSDFDDLDSLRALRQELSNLRPLPAVYQSLVAAMERAFLDAATPLRDFEQT
jgi:rSAM/selenodomain-associated transferase 1